ncbi:hypothetical protein [Hyphococcus lacteus]|uniref:Uncharacterized protein n=1 Tax=Hyphococcus lacteus TaxID=3143536 RepID=A0ABV3Z4F5_9PROT
MKKPFNAKSNQTYASREAELEAHASQIDEYLKTPKAPGSHFTPQGEMRRNGTQYAHNALAQKRVDITRELSDIKQEMAKRNKQEQAKAKAL